MNELAIERLTASAVAVSDVQTATDARLRGLLHRVAGGRLDSALSEVTVPQGHWCIRRLDLALTLDLDRPDAALETQWARALVDAITTAIANRSTEVVYYPRMIDALVDLLVSAARHSDDHAWAWGQVGLPTAAGRGVRSGGADLTELVLSALRQRPQEAAAAVTACARAAGAAPLHRILGSRGWIELAQIVLGAVGVSSRHSVDLLDPRDGVGLPTSTGIHSVPTSIGCPPTGDRPCSGAASLLAGLVHDLLGRSLLAGLLGQLPVRVEPPLARAWSVMVAAEAAPSILLRADADLVINALAESFVNAAPAAHGFLGDEQFLRPGHTTASQRRRTDPSEVEESSSDLARDATEHQSDATNDIHAAETLWAGLLFLLNTAAQAGFPEVLLDDRRLLRRPLWRTMSEVLQRMVPISPDNPALLAMCGLPRYEVGDAFSDHEQTQIDVCASKWAESTAERMGVVDEDPKDVCLHVALRRGSIATEPGWIEVHLDLEDVDIDVRRAGLDLDPGWIPWLGCVVRFRYD